MSLYQAAIASKDIGRVAHLFMAFTCPPGPLDTPEDLEDRQVALAYYLAHVAESVRRSHEEQ